MESKMEHEGQGRIFLNRYLDYFTKAPAPVSATIYVLIAIGLLCYGYATGVVASVWSGIGIYIGAVFFWTFFEYFFHRYINHLDDYFPESRLARQVAYTIHGIHHEYPRDKERLIMPPIPGLMVVAILYLVFTITMAELVYIFMPGFMTGYLIYTYVHISLHKPKMPSWLKVQYRHHALHHYKYPEKAFGVSTTLWDRVFGTMPPDF